MTNQPVGTTVWKAQYRHIEGRKENEGRAPKSSCSVNGLVFWRCSVRILAVTSVILRVSRFCWVPSCKWGVRPRTTASISLPLHQPSSQRYYHHHKTTYAVWFSEMLEPTNRTTRCQNAEYQNVKQIQWRWRPQRHHIHNEFHKMSVFASCELRYCRRLQFNQPYTAQSFWFSYLLFFPLFSFPFHLPSSSLCIKLYNSMTQYKHALTWNSWQPY